MRISDWSSDVCSSDLLLILGLSAALQPLAIQMQTLRLELPAIVIASATLLAFAWDGTLSRLEGLVLVTMGVVFTLAVIRAARRESLKVKLERSEEHTSELQSLMRISSAVFCLKKKNKTN